MPDFTDPVRGPGATMEEGKMLRWFFKSAKLPPAMCVHKWVEGRGSDFGHRHCARCGQRQMLFVDPLPRSYWKDCGLTPKTRRQTATPAPEGADHG